MRIILASAFALFVASSVVMACESESTPDGSSSGSTSSSSSGSTSSSSSGGSSSGAIPDGGENDADASEASIATMTLTSTAFNADGEIPADHSCDGAGVSIPLAWGGAPAGTQSVAIVMRDLDLAGDDNYHWVIWDIPATTTSLPDDIPTTENPDPPGGGAKQAPPSFKGIDFGYFNPCPPQDDPTHEYELAVYAFSVATLPLGGAEGAKAVDAVIQANKTAKGTLRGKYTRVPPT